MGISKEFADAVEEKNVLRVRIMLKDSLLYDKTFDSFSMMEKYATQRGVNPYGIATYPIKKVGRPWTEDVMNSELTILVSDFTRERIEYIKTIIQYLYPNQRMQQGDNIDALQCKNSPQNRYRRDEEGLRSHKNMSQARYSTHSIYSANYSLRDNLPVKQHTVDPFDVISKNTDRINRTLRRCETRQYYKCIEDIKKSAINIESACNQILKRRYQDGTFRRF